MDMTVGMDPGTAKAWRRFMGVKPKKAKRAKKEPSLIAGPPGSVVLALDGRNAYRVMPNGEHRKLGAEEAADFHERFRAMEAGA
jgi:hypothetical protein